MMISIYTNQGRREKIENMTDGDDIYQTHLLVHLSTGSKRFSLVQVQVINALDDFFPRFIHI